MEGHDTESAGGRVARVMRTLALSVRPAVGYPIPQVARLVGVYDSTIGYGQDGVRAIWDRIIYPAGSSLGLSGMLGQGRPRLLRASATRLTAAINRLVGFAILTNRPRSIRNCVGSEPLVGDLPDCSSGGG